MVDGHALRFAEIGAQDVTHPDDQPPQNLAAADLRRLPRQRVEHVGSSNSSRGVRLQPIDAGQRVADDAERFLNLLYPRDGAGKRVCHQVRRRAADSERGTPAATIAVPLTRCRATHSGTCLCRSRAAVDHVQLDKPLAGRLDGFGDIGPSPGARHVNVQLADLATPRVAEIDVTPPGG